MEIQTKVKASSRQWQDRQLLWAADCREAGNFFSLLFLQQGCMRKMNTTAGEHRKEWDFQFGFVTGEKGLYGRKKKKSAPSAERSYSSLSKHL